MCVEMDWKDRPISFSVDLIEFEALVQNTGLAFSSSMARQRDPNLVMNHPPQKKREKNKVRKVPLCFILHHVLVNAVNHPRRQKRVLQTKNQQLHKLHRFISIYTIGMLVVSRYDARLIDEQQNTKDETKRFSAVDNRLHYIRSSF